MNPEQPKIESLETKQSSEKTEKEKHWQEIAKNIEQTVDSLEKSLDPGIKETVIALNMLGINTASSCEGHTDHGYTAPWVQIETPNEPEEQFIGEKVIFQKIADKYGISFEDVRRAINEKAWKEAYEESSNNPEAPEYKRWLEENRKLGEKLSKLLEEFYKDREVSPDIRLNLEGLNGKMLRIYGGGENYVPVHRLTDEQKKEITQLLPRYQEEMHAFTEFLKRKYFEKSNH